MDKGGSVVPQNVHSDCTCTHVYSGVGRLF